MGEKVCRAACCDELMTVAVAPHQVYGPRDLLFLPNLLEAGRSGMLRIFGDGKNRIAFTHVDNYCHGLCLGARALYKGSPALGKFYICTDGDYEIFWDVISNACVSLGFQSLHDKVQNPNHDLFLLISKGSNCSLYFLQVTSFDLSSLVV